MCAALAGPAGTSGLLHQVAAGHDPARLAIRFQGTELTYGEVEHRSNQLAHALLDAGVKPGHVVALLLERGLDLPVAQLAVMKTGAAWMPLDPQHPPARLAFQGRDAAVPLVLSTANLADLAGECAPDVACWLLDRLDVDGYPDTPPDAGVRPDDAAYLIYTSGSTGTPKGVLVSHRSAYGYCRNAVDLLGVTAADRIPQVANPAFDVSIFDCFATLLAGATIVSAPRQMFSDPAAFTALLCEEDVTLAYVPPTILALLDPAQLAGSRLRTLFSAGAALSAELVNRWSRPGLEIHNSYGPTETTVICTDYRCPGTPVDGPVPIGTALPGQRAYVLDKRLRPVPVGVAGQLFIAGSGVAHGYLNRSGLTAQRFLADPYTDQPGQRMYATGDLARWRSDGVIEYLGRTDRQVKLRGQRVELGEIEHALSSHPAVRQCAVVLRDDTYLAAYVVSDGDPDLTEHVAQRLPTYMIPTAIITLPELPLTPNGKLDTARLPDPARRTHEYVRPRTDTERWLAATWQELLGVAQVGAEDSFFALGGNSLHGTQLIARIRQSLRVALDLRHLFSDRTLAELAARLDGAEVASAEKAIVPVARGHTLPCTPQQEGLWFLHRLDPSSAVYHIPFAMRLRGGLDVGALNRALCALVVRHEALRTRFVEQDGVPRQVIDPPPTAFPLPVRHVPAERVESWVAEQFTRPFELTAGSLFRAALARLGPDEHAIALVVHHIVADGWSAKILADELSVLYAGGEVAPLRVQPADHAAWQRGWLDGAEMQRQLTYWRDTLADLSTVDFPTDRPRPAQPTGGGATRNRLIPDDLAAAARTYARTNQVSFLAVLQAALLTVLHRYTGQTDLTIGSIFSGRTRADIEPVVGFFANTLVLRTDVSGAPTFAELVRRCHTTVLNAAAHQDVPFGLIVDTLQPERVAGRNPLFQISLTLQPANTQADLTLGDLAAEPLAAANGYARFDIAIDVIDAPDGLGVSLEYSTELFDADRIERLVDHLIAALAGGLAEPDTATGNTDILPAAERHQVLHAWNPAPVERTPGLLHRVTAGHDPTRVAIRFQGTELTYGQLEQRSNQLAHALRDAGVKPGHVVALLLERGPHLPVAQLAVLKTGAAWMPLDPQHPPTRLAFQITDTAAPVLLTTSNLADLARDCASNVACWLLDQVNVASQPDTPADTDVRPDDPAYLIYTSGSTGTPKGVLVSHRSGHGYCRNAVERYGITAHDRVAQLANPAFDATILDCFATLLAGATIVSAPRETFSDPAAFTALLRDEQVTFSFVPPAFLRLLDPRDLRGSRLRALLVGGEALDAQLLNRWSPYGLEIHHGYGPTETTVACTDYLCPGTPVDGPVPIGTALPDHRAYLLDAALRPAPIGVPGQLYIAGSGVAHGYLNRSGLTAERFLPDPYTDQPGQRMYATGDLARWRSDGVIEFLGRTDRQVKLRGQRLELGEIEHVLGSHPGVRQCAVVLRDNSYLVAYVVTVGDPDLNAHLSDRLPTYMVPAVFVTLPELPLTSNGKLDTARLPDPTPPRREYVPPRTDTERWLAATWQELLDVEQVGAQDNFFDLGGSSLHGTQLAARVRDGLGIELEPRHLFTNPVLHQLAARLDCSRTARADDVTALQPAGTRPPLFFVHPAGGSVAHYVRLAPLLGTDQPFYAIEDPGLHGAPIAGDLAERARRYVELIRRVRPHGPYRLGGWSLGGIVAHEVARQLTEAGEAVEIVVALDSSLATDAYLADDRAVLASFVRDLAGIAGVRPPDVDPRTLRGLDRDALEDRVLAVLDGSGLVPPDMREDLRTRMRVFAANVRAVRAHLPRGYAGRLVLVSAADSGVPDRSAWQALSPAFEHRTVPGNHYTMLQPPHLDALAAAVRDCLR